VAAVSIVVFVVGLFAGFANCLLAVVRTSTVVSFVGLLAGFASGRLAGLMAAALIAGLFAGFGSAVFAGFLPVPFVDFAAGLLAVVLGVFFFAIVPSP
jgi:hypothetical protein